MCGKLVSVRPEADKPWGRGECYGWRKTVAQPFVTNIRDIFLPYKILTYVLLMMKSLVQRFKSRKITQQS